MSWLSNNSIERLILILIFISTYGFSCVYFSNDIFQTLLYISCFIIIYIYVKNKKKLPDNLPLSKLIIVLIIYPIMSFILTTVLYNPGAWGYYKYRVISLAFFLLFYIYYCLRVKEKALIKSFVVVGIIVFIIQIIQQIFPENAIFGLSILDGEVKEVEIRNGLYRYRLISVYFITMLCVFYYWQQLLLRVSRKNIFMLCLFLISMYLFLTRQIMFSVGISLLLSFILIKNRKAKKWSIIGIIFISILLFFFYDSIFGELLEKANDELDETNIRVTCFSFYWEKIIHSPLTVLFGNGFPALLIDWQKILHLTPSDIGMIGECFYFGIIWILIYFYTLYIVFIKYRKFLPLYIKLYFLSTFLISIMIFPYRSGIEFLIWTSVLYITSIYIKSKQIQI